MPGAEHAERDDGERRLRRRASRPAAARARTAPSGSRAERAGRSRPAAAGSASTVRPAYSTEPRSRARCRARRAPRAARRRSARRRGARRRRSRPRSRRAATPGTRWLASIRDASSTVKIGAAAWITAVSPESRCVSAKPSSQNGSALLSAAEHDERDERSRKRREPAAAGTTSEQDQRADDDAAEHDDRRLELVHAEPDEHERRAPDRREQQQEQGVTRLKGTRSVMRPQVGTPSGDLTARIRRGRVAAASAAACRRRRRRARAGLRRPVRMSPELRRGTATPPPARPHGRGARPHPACCSSASRTTSSSPSSRCSGRSTAGTSTPRCC